MLYRTRCLTDLRQVARMESDYKARVTPETSRVWQELYDVPLLKTVGDIYTKTRDSNRLLHTGLALVESTCNIALDTAYSASIATAVDSKVGACVARLKENFPEINMSPEEIKRAGSLKVHKGVKTAMLSRPAQYMLSGLDWTVDASERLLRRLKPRESSPRKKTRRSKRALERKSKMEDDKDQSYASEDSGACDSTDVKHKDQDQQTKISLMKKEQIKPGPVVRVYKACIVFPLEVTVTFLKKVRRFLYAKSGRRRSQRTLKVVSPDKEAQIDARRKVSPRKKTDPTFLSRLKLAAYRILGSQNPNFRPLNLDDISDITSPCHPESDGDRKRKHDEIQTDQGSGSDESDNDNFLEFDWDNYDSADDSDYNPGEDSGEVSEDLSEDCASESDLEEELILSPTATTPGLQLTHSKERKDKVTEASKDEKDKPKEQQDKPKEKQDKPKEKQDKPKEKQDKPKEKQDKPKEQKDQPKDEKDKMKEEKVKPVTPGSVTVNNNTTKSAKSATVTKATVLTNGNHDDKKLTNGSDPSDIKLGTSPEMVLQAGWKK